MDDLIQVVSKLANSSKLSKPIRVVGIDLGTTNSVLAYIDIIDPSKSDFEIKVLEVAQETRSGKHFGELLPSAIAIHNGMLYIGHGAIHCRGQMNQFGLEQDKNIFWDTKNLMGIERTFHRSPEGFNNAKQIAAQILKFLNEQIKTTGNSQIKYSTVTVPASFNPNQKADTKWAAETAGIPASELSLLNEPTAAFIAYSYLYMQGRSFDLSSPKNLIVFDFGGGTCDVALFSLRRSNGEMSQSLRAVSRYHRLGGGDIDRAIVVDVLLPKLYVQNQVTSHDFDFFEKSKELIPQLLSSAESLKVGLCGLLTHAEKTKDYEGNKAGIKHTLTRTIKVELKSGQSLFLESPSLSLAEFEIALNKFLEEDLLYHRESEYGMACSIFAPLQNVLSRADLHPMQVHYCLAVGGSCLIPQIQAAIAKYFVNAEILTFKDHGENQTCVARGAALQALHLASGGSGLVPPTSSDSISIRTEGGGTIQLVPANARLPFPSENEWSELGSLRAPKSAIGSSFPLRLELVDSEDLVVSKDTWQVNPVVNKGDSLRLQYRMDENQCVELKMSLAATPDVVLYHDTRNPFSNVASHNVERERILELEERMRSETMNLGQQINHIDEIARLEHELGNNEKALGLLSRLNQRTPDAQRLHRMGMICGDLQDYDRQDKFYRESARLLPHSGAALFNLALSFKRRGRIADAVECAKEARSKCADPPYQVLEIELAQLAGTEVRDFNGELEEAIRQFPDLWIQNDFELSWYRNAAVLTNNKQLLKQIDDERNRRVKKGDDSGSNDGYLPLGIQGIIPKS